MKNISVLSLSLLNRLIVSLVIMMSVISVFLGFASNARAQTCPAGLEFFDNLLDGSGFVFPSATNGSTTDNFGRTWKWNITGNTSNFACGSTPTLANGRLQHCYDWVNPGDGINVTATVTGGAVTNPVVFLADIDGGAPGLGWQDEFTWNSPAATAFTPAQNPYSFDISGSTFTGNANNADNSNYGAGSMLVTTGTSTNSFSYTYRAGPDTNPPGGQFVWVSFGSCMSVTPETTKTADAPSPAYPGDTVTYTVTITSPDDWDVAYNGFVDTLGSALEAKSVDLVNSTCAFVGDASISAASPGNTISWTSGAPYFIPKSTSCTIIYTAEIDPNLSIGSALTCDGIPGDDANDNLINIDFTNINGSSNITANSCFTITSANPELTLSKTASAVSYNAVGNVITYTYSIENTGDVVITEDILIEDDKLASDVTCTTVDLAVSGTIECEATYSITQADLDAGSLTNIAFAKTTHSGNPLNSATDSVTINAVQTPALSIDKSTSTTDYDSTTDTIAYSYLVTNTGNVSFTNAITVADDKTTTSCPALPGGTLAPGASITCTASYSVVQVDIDNGSVTNIASASTTHGGNPVNSGNDTVTVNAVQTPGISLNKSATVGSYDDPADTIPYEYEVTNSGNVTLTQAITVTDDKVTVTCPALPGGGLTPGSSITCAASYDVAQLDIDAGSVTNIASASTSYGGNPLSTGNDTVTVNALQLAGLTIDKTTTTADYDATTDTISYEYEVTNAGNVTLTSTITVTDDKTTVSCPALPGGALAPGASITCTASYSVTQADLDNGSVTNIASASSSFGGNPVNSADDTVTVNADQNPALSIVKSTSTADYDDPTDIIAYSYEVTNSGNVTITSTITVTDDKTTATCPALPGGAFAPGASITCSATYNVVQSDIDTGSVTNIASAATTFGGNPVTSGDDTVTVAAIQNPALTLVKSTSTADYDATTDTIAYSYEVTNSGNVTFVEPVTVTDDKTSVTCPALPGGALAPGASITCSATYNVVQGDLDAGSVTNIATASSSFDGSGVDSNNDSVTVDAVQNPAISLAKSADSADYDATTDVISYDYEVTNSGNVTITQPITATDDKTTVTCPALPVGGLAPAASVTCTSTYNILQLDIDFGSLTNVAQASTSFGGNPVDSNSDTVTLAAIQLPALHLDKSSPTSSYAVAGQSITYVYQVTNSGNGNIGKSPGNFFP